METSIANLVIIATQVKADREDIDASQDNIEKLQKETTELLQEKHGDGK